jgi:catechol 2,3-dioxygenase
VTITLGHVVLAVGDLAASTRFYRDVLGLRVVENHPRRRQYVTVLTGGSTHHELALFGAPGVQEFQNKIGLHQLAWRVGDHDDDLRKVRDRLTVLGIPIERLADHGIVHSLYLRDPDGHEIELFVDVPGVDADAVLASLETPEQPLTL